MGITTSTAMAEGGDHRDAHSLPRRLKAIVSSTTTTATNKTEATVPTEEPAAHSSTAPNFEKWRPNYHLMPHSGWMNDPCGIGFDDTTGLYHVGFQWNPKGYEWGNMSWGSAVSPDLVTWQVHAEASIEPDTKTGEAGVFTGSMVPSGWPGHQGGILTSFYTSARSLPIHYTLPYTWGSEEVHMATSEDAGKTWKRPPGNPIVPGAPEGQPVTGWRDPFLAAWDRVDQLLGQDKAHIYGLLSGGIRDKTPTAFLYQIDPEHMDKWTFISSLFSLGVNREPSRWTGDFGRNFEVANVILLTDSPGSVHEFITAGVEGRRKVVPMEHPELIADHNQMWVCGQSQLSSDRSIEMQYKYGGTVDFGNFYAMNGFVDPATKDFVVFGWISEADLSEDLTALQQWSGCMSIPRVLSLFELHSVSGALATKLEDITSIGVKPTGDGEFTVFTLAMRPDPRLQILRQRHHTITPKTLSPHQITEVFFPKGCSRWELQTSLSLGDNRIVGLEVFHSEDKNCSTRIYFDPESETVVVDRSQSSSITGINRSPYRAPHTLFSCRTGGSGSSTTTEKQESLDFHIFYDKSVLEIFINGRATITARVYPDSGTSFGVGVYVDGIQGQGDADCTTELLAFDIWELK